MQAINNGPECLKAIQYFAVHYGQYLPADDANRLIEASSAVSSVVSICDCAEILYAAQAEIADATAKSAAQTLCGQLADFAAMNGWHALGNPLSTEPGAPSRGIAIRWAMQRELGESAPVGTAFPSASADPSPDPRFRPPPPVEVEAPAPQADPA